MTEARGVNFKGLSKSFDGKAMILNRLDVNIPAGQFTALLGPSGCGKTTLLRLLAGFDQPTEGEIKIGDTVVAGPGQFIQPEKRNIGMVFQNYAVWPHMTVFENIAFPLKMRKLPRAEIKSVVEEQMARVKLDGLGHRKPSELSGGQQQRVALARALAQSPQILLLDEPLSNLDPHLREQMRHEIRRLQQLLGMTAIIVTHDWKDAGTMCDQIIVLNHGKVEQAGTPEDLRLNPKTDLVRNLISHS